MWIKRKLNPVITNTTPPTPKRNRLKTIFHDKIQLVQIEQIYGNKLPKVGVASVAHCLLSWKSRQSYGSIHPVQDHT